MLQGFIIHIKIMEAVSKTVDTQIIASKEEAVRHAEEIG